MTAAFTILNKTRVSLLGAQYHWDAPLLSYLGIYKKGNSVNGPLRWVCAKQPTTYLLLGVAVRPQHFRSNMFLAATVVETALFSS